MSAVKEPKKRRLPLRRRHSLAGPRANHNQQKDERGRSLFKFLMSKPWKQRSVSTPTIDRGNVQAIESCSHGNSEGSNIKVVASVLQPQLYYKSVPVTMETTVNDVIVTLVTKYAVIEEDKDPDTFYLMETHDRTQGSYSQVLSNSELIEVIVQRWGGDHGYFTLTRRPTTIKSEPLFSSSPSLFSATEESTLFTSNPTVFIEEGRLSQSLSDISDIQSTSPQKHSTPHAIANLISPYSQGASRKAVTRRSAGNITDSSSRLQDSSMGSYSTSYSYETSSPLSPSPISPLIINSPTHQYIVTTGSTNNHHGNIGDYTNNSIADGMRFHFPSANPSSPTEVCNHDNRNSLTTRDENEHKSEIGNDNDDNIRERRAFDEMTPHTQRRKRMNELMETSIEAGLTQIMTQVVQEGRDDRKECNHSDYDEDEEKCQSPGLESRVITIATMPDTPPTKVVETIPGSSEEVIVVIKSPTIHSMASFDLPHSIGEDNDNNSSNSTDQFHSAMNILDSFSATIEVKFGTTSRQADENGTKTETKNDSKSTPQAMPTTPNKEIPRPLNPVKPEDLVSPQRRHRLVEESARKFKLKRAHTIDVGIGHTPSDEDHTLSDEDHTHMRERSGTTTVVMDLISSKRREKMLTKAMAAVRKRLQPPPTTD